LLFTYLLFIVRFLTTYTDCFMSGKKISLADWQQQLGRPAEDTATTHAEDLVYSTNSGRIEKPKQQKAAAPGFADGHARLKRETKGRNGKAVITISGLNESADKLSEIAALLKKKCGCGGSVKDGVIEIQGDQRELVQQELTKLGYKHKWAGG
jgi:translation initiation factor 1